MFNVTAWEKTVECESGASVTTIELGRYAVVLVACGTCPVLKQIWRTQWVRSHPVSLPPILACRSGGWHD
ncbi:hypothetical protein IQ268_14165 [Oculatella sp. LEGE 06141]|uniref:hypothetical protein n=1 Tax=Oculatella sp. LEGE 06141 TaxID=1828648 RepID=UPI001882E5D0|nr:hypothetical protein [Oculatella sp. LEGE 06141]MBE9179710.1 hypothetical protein [Oculatella sp. LEGE 06141]